MYNQISFLNIWSINQTVNQGDLVFTIIPDDNSSYIARLKTPAQNSGKMKIGQKVNIKLDNYPSRIKFIVFDTKYRIVFKLIPEKKILLLLKEPFMEELLPLYLPKKINNILITDYLLDKEN